MVEIEVEVWRETKWNCPGFVIRERLVWSVGNTSKTDHNCNSEALTDFLKNCQLKERL
jgi:hypothetical protein